MSTKVNELREQMLALAANARKELDSITPETDASRAKEIEARFDTIMADHDAIAARVERETRMLDIEKRAIEAKRPVSEQKTAAAVAESGALPEYRAVFAKAICGGLDDMTPEERQVLHKGRTEFRAQTGGVTTAGGFTVPTTLADFIVRSMLAWGPMYSDDLCTTLKTASGNPIKIPTVDDTAVTAVAHTEGTALTDTGAKDVVFGQKSLDAYAFDTQFIRWSWELDMDSIFNMESLLGDLLGERLGRIANLQLTSGTGTNAPNGILTASTLGKTTAGVSAITADEIIDFVHSVDPAYRQSTKSRLMFNDSTLQAIRKLKNSQNDYIVTTAPDGTGRLNLGAISVPYTINQAMPSLGTGNKFMLYGDFGKYFVRKVGEPVIGTLKERFWPDMGIAGLIRFDGELGDTAAVKHMKNA